MKTHPWLFVLGVLACVGCDGSYDSPMNPPGTTNERTAAITSVVGDDCDTSARCEEIGSGKNFATREECVTRRQTFWNDKWPTAQCEAKIDEGKLQACREAVQSLLCNNLTDALKTYNTVCASSEVCTGQP